jgi:spore coat protein U-like protein
MGSYTDTVTATVYVGGVSYATTTFSVAATVAANCTILATSLAFGNYAGALIDSTATISVTCTNTTPYNVGLNAGLATGATVTNRSMTGPASALLGYKLFSNSAYTTNWGNTVGTDTVARTGNGATQPLTVYGQILAGQFATPGSYTDTITVSVTY